MTGEDGTYQDGKRDTRLDVLEKRLDALDQKIWWLITAVAAALITNFPSIIQLVVRK